MASRTGWRFFRAERRAGLTATERRLSSTRDWSLPLCRGRGFGNRARRLAGHSFPRMCSTSSRMIGAGHGNWHPAGGCATSKSAAQTGRGSASTAWIEHAVLRHQNRGSQRHGRFSGRVDVADSRRPVWSARLAGGIRGRVKSQPRLRSRFRTHPADWETSSLQGVRMT